MVKLFHSLILFLLVFFFVSCDKEDPVPSDEVSIAINPTELTFTYEAGTNTLSVTSSDDWGVSSSADWCTVTPGGGIAGTGSITVKVAQNKDESARTAILTFKSGSFKKDYAVTQGYEVKEVNFLDDIFKAYCLNNFDTDADGLFSQKEAEAVQELNIQGLGISSLDGIENFTSLITLNCSNNNLTSIEISALTNLTFLNCSGNQLSELNIRLNVNLEGFDCTGNSALTFIYVWTGFSPSSAFKKPDSAQYIEPEIATPRGYSLVWHDEFNDARSETGQAALPSTSGWWYETGNGGWGNNELQNYIPAVSGTDTCAMIYDGSLKIIAKKTSSEVLSIRMNTSHSWTYGYFEARLKLPAGKGTWPAFWMMPKNFTSWPGDGEIDIMEEVGYRPNYVSSTIHCNAYNHSIGTQKSAEIYISTSQTNFHIYAVEWTENFIEGYVDGNKYFEFKNDGLGNNNTWPFNDPFYLKLNLAWGGNWGGAQGVDESALPATFEIDYVRVFQKNN